MALISYTGIMILIWVINLFNGTGLGEAYRTTEYAKSIVVLLSIVIVLIKYSREHQMLIKRRDFFCFGLLSAVFLGSSYMQGYGLSGFDYLWAYLIVLIIAQLKANEKAVTLVGLIYGVLGAVILYIYNYGSTLSGWNENTIAMVGMHSYLVFIIPFFKERDLKSKLLLFAGTAVYIPMLMPTDSRSGILFAIIGALAALKIIPRKLIDGGNKRILFFLILPVIIAILVAKVSQTEVVQRLNIWSYNQFQKSLFNGRDKIWLEGFQRLWRQPLFGTGYLMTGYWHNCALACLTAYGWSGFILWLNSLHNIIGRARAWLNDYIIEGCMISFLILYVQQSVELGLFGPNPNLIPYVILGMMLGRVRVLRGKYPERKGMHYV